MLLYLIDTLRADKLAPYNPQTRVRTPNLSTFVETAAAMTRAHTQDNWTTPSVATLLSSLMPWQHTATTGEAVVPESVRLLPELLSSRGFYTGSFIANGYVSDRFGFRQGWDTYRNYIREELRTQAEFVAADVLQWLDRRPQDEPFFLYVHAIDPHVPYRPPEEFISMYDPGSYGGPVNFRRDATLLENIKLGRIPLSARDKARLEALYDGEITYHDVHFGAIMEGLARRGIADETMIVVTADHGEEFWDHGSVGHGHNVYEELLHIPMFVRLPGVTGSAIRVDAPVGLVDVMPTILDGLGQEIPEDLMGRSILDLVRGAAGTERVAVSGFMDNWRAIALDRYKLIVKPDGSAMLFDLQSDPGEEHDIAADKPRIAGHLRGRLGLELERTRGGGTSAARRPVHQRQETEIDDETRRQLRALGYVQ
ncbi:MAG: sulfatase [Rhodospirillales bacterium]|nr:sulfatase [Rhodospirillales bacterium]